MKKFALIGAAGYIAPRHMRAIKETGNQLVAALDKNDSVGIIDSYFPDASFFTEFERFDRHLEKERRENGHKVDYVSICSPNYLHDAHIRFALRIQADAICEKPVVLNPWNLDALELISQETGKSIHTILQLRLHPSIVSLKKKIDEAPSDKKHEIDLAYITARGKWYSVSWKGDIEKSGGVATNIGVHFFDMLKWIFGGMKYSIVHLDDPMKAAGFLELDSCCGLQKKKYSFSSSSSSRCSKSKIKSKKICVFRHLFWTKYLHSTSNSQYRWFWQIKICNSIPGIIIIKYVSQIFNEKS